MTFFDSYNLSLLTQDIQADEYKNQFVASMYHPQPSRCIPMHPLVPSRPVTPPRMALEAELLHAKKKMDEFHQFEKQKETYYEQVSRLIDPFSFYKSRVRTQVKPEKSMTNAWLKCWEMIHRFDLLRFDTETIHVFCNAELPGAFLFAIHHFMHTGTNQKLEWQANSLYPSEGNILGDDFGLVRNYPEKWLMNKDQNGDVTRLETVLSVQERCENKIQLYTSDIGIEMTHETFERQEEIEAPLNLGQILCGLVSLAEGGNLICKTFMFFSPFSQSLIYLTSLCFDEFFIYKPETSRTGNSEVYLVGKGFRANEDIIQLFSHKLETWTADYMNEYMVPIPEDAYLKLFYALHRIYSTQIQFIEAMVTTVRRLFHAGKPSTFFHVSKTALWRDEQKRLKEWEQRYPIPMFHGNAL
jgi:23S rRNA U2552 (ribose-2'-O)-methylase RlmE/FtsJ